MDALLPAGLVADRRVAISASDSPDLDRLGLSGLHVTLALGEVARAVLLGGGTLAYGGDLRPGGFTDFLLGELQRYAAPAEPSLLVCLAWQSHRELPLHELRERIDRLRLYARFLCLDPDGDEVAPGQGRGDDPVPVDDAVRPRALTAMRRYLESRVHARVLIGGRRHGYQGRLPGLVEEALLALDEAKPLYLAGGFGGATADVAGVLRPTDAQWLPPAPAEPGYLEGLRLLSEVVNRPGWSRPDNGLRPEENTRLAATHRPSEIANLVTLGLGRTGAGTP